MKRRAQDMPSGGLASRASRRWAIAGVALGVLLAVAAWAPASWLASAIDSATDGRMILAESRGTVWNGSAVVVLTGGEQSQAASALPGRLQWLMRPNLQQGAGFAIALEQACCINGRATVVIRPGLGRVEFELLPVPNWIARWPATWLSGLGTPWNTLDLGGQLRLKSPGLRMQSVKGRWHMAGSAELELQDMSSRISTLPTLGSYRLAAQADPDSAGATLALSTIEGALRLDATGSWNGTGLRLRGAASAATPGDEAVLGNLLNIIGRRQGARSVISIG